MACPKAASDRETPARSWIRFHVWDVEGIQSAKRCKPKANSSNPQAATTAMMIGNAVAITRLSIMRPRT
ncbi:hypothetical protein C6369_004830 [Rhodococcus rhodochrous]|nr:hypothetical protein C6369_004830 [Rhodococcus rhodochrous]